MLITSFDPCRRFPNLLSFSIFLFGVPWNSHCNVHSPHFPHFHFYFGSFAFSLSYSWSGSLTSVDDSELLYSNSAISQAAKESLLDSTIPTPSSGIFCNTRISFLENHLIKVAMHALKWSCIPVACTWKRMGRSLWEMNGGMRGSGSRCDECEGWLVGMMMGNKLMVVSMVWVWWMWRMGTGGYEGWSCT